MLSLDQENIVFEKLEERDNDASEREEGGGFKIMKKRHIFEQPLSTFAFKAKSKAAGTKLCPADVGFEKKLRKIKTWCRCRTIVKFHFHEMKKLNILAGVAEKVIMAAEIFFNLLTTCLLTCLFFRVVHLRSATWVCSV